MAKFPRDAPSSASSRRLESLGFRVVREQEHIAMVRANADGTQTPLTRLNHWRIKGSTLRTIRAQANVPRNDFLRAIGKREVAGAVATTMAQTVASRRGLG